MSVFRQLMMKRFHSAENHINLALVGSLTNNNGIVSGWETASDYVYTNDFVLDVSQDFEIVVKANTGTMYNGNYKTIIRNAYGGNTLTGFAIGLEGTTHKTQAYIVNSSGTQVVSGTQGQTVFSSNTDFLLKFSQNGNTIKIETSLDNGTTWVTENSWNNISIRNSGIGVSFGGGGSNTNQFWMGSFDFNSSYIKLGTTKYNFQFAIPLTKVGSPTITDGVVSGFSSTNYVKTPILSNVSSLHLHLEETINNVPSATAGVFMFGSKDAPSLEFQGYTHRIYILNSDNTTSVYGYQGVARTLGVPVEIDFFFENGISHFVVTQNGVNKLDKSYENTILPSAGISFGWRWNPLTDGNINFNNSYIVIDGTKYIFTV